jgi:hypothetical protein
MELGHIEKGDVKADVKFEKGEVVFASSLDSHGVKGEVKLSVSSEYFLDKLAAAIPGQLDDQVLAMLKIALKGM